jgi:hypothetical protein
MTKSMYLRPSASWMWAPRPFSTKIGVPPTDLNARTGLFTPPGRMRVAAAKSFSERGYRDFVRAMGGMYHGVRN